MRLYESVYSFPCKTCCNRIGIIDKKTHFVGLVHRNSKMMLTCNLMKLQTHEMREMGSFLRYVARKQIWKRIMFGVVKRFGGGRCLRR